MNLKNITVGLVLLLACVSYGAPSAHIPATAILDTPPGFNAGAGAGLLTDGTIGGDNWLSNPWRYMGWTDPGYAGTDGGTDSGVAQPQLTFDLGGTFFVDSVTIHYMVDYPAGTLRANVHAPDSMAATFSTTGPNGSFGGSIVEAGFDDSPESDTTSGGGKARTLVLNTGGVPANAVRLGFLTDAEWLMLSEVTFHGRPTTNVAVRATAILDTPPNFNASAGAGLITDGVVGGDNWLCGPWQYLGWQDAGYVPTDSGTDSGVAQPQLRFDLGGTYYITSVIVDYNVDYPPGSLRANLRAPDSMTAAFSASGVSGSFGGNLVETGFDDSPEGDATAGGGKARSLTLATGLVSANAVRLDFRTDGEWLFLSEVTIRALVERTNTPPPITNVLIQATVTLDTPPNFNGEAGAGLLTDGVIGGNNWLNNPRQYLGWLDSGYVPTDGGVDSGVPQPQLTFNLGGNYFVDTVTIHYIVDYPAGALRGNLHAPDSMTATFSASDANGFNRAFVGTGFDDSPEGDTSAGGGQARSMTFSLGSVAANAVRLDFRTDAEWLFISEVTFRGKTITNVPVPIPATAILDTPPNFNGDAGAALLTDGIVGGNNWLSNPWRYMGWQDAGYVPSDSGVDSGVAQPQLTFALGGKYWVNSVRVHYMVDYPPNSLYANLRAPDLMTAQFSASGTSGPFGGNLVETGFDDSPEPDGTGGGGQARSVTMDLGNTPANAMRLDFRTDGEWLFMSEITFLGTAVPSPNPVATLSGSGPTGSVRIKFDTVAGLWYRVVRSDILPATTWTDIGFGWKQGLGLPMEVGLGNGQPSAPQGYFRIEISPTQPED